MTTSTSESCFLLSSLSLAFSPTTRQHLFSIVVFFNVSVLQESKSAKIMEGFKNLVPQYAVARRNGEKITVKAEELTLGDVVEIKFGDRIPADIRVIECRGFKVPAAQTVTSSAEPFYHMLLFRWTTLHLPESLNLKQGAQNSLMRFVSSKEFYWMKLFFQ